jgi:pyridoxal phosphate enzyme (YggS family)
VKYIAPFVHLIHSVDSLKLLKEIDKQAKKNNRRIDCLLQFHIAQEETKFGLSLLEAVALISSEEFKELKNINIVGVMGMASFSDNESLIKKEFQALHSIFKNLQEKCFYENQNFKEISMGMSGDYLLAMQEGSTMVRIGSTIFGGRN